MTWKRKKEKKKRKGKKREAITSQLFFQHGGKIYCFTTWTSTGFSVPPFFSCPFLFMNHTYVMEWLKKNKNKKWRKRLNKKMLENISGMDASTRRQQHLFVQGGWARPRLLNFRLSTFFSIILLSHFQTPSFWYLSPLPTRFLSSPPFQEIAVKARLEEK